MKLNFSEVMRSHALEDMQDYYSCSSGSGSASEAEGDFDDVNSEASFHTCRTHITTVSDRYTPAGLLSPMISAAAASLVAHSLAAGSRHTPHTSALDSATQAMPAVKSDMLDNVSPGLVGDATGQACVEYNGINTASCGLGNASELDQLVEDAEKGVLSVDPLSGPKLDHEHPDLQAEEPANKRVSAVTKSQVHVDLPKAAPLVKTPASTRARRRLPPSVLSIPDAGSAFDPAAQLPIAARPFLLSSHLEEEKLVQVTLNTIPSNDNNSETLIKLHLTIPEPASSVSIFVFGGMDSCTASYSASPLGITLPVMAPDSQANTPCRNSPLIVHGSHASVDLSSSPSQGAAPSSVCSQALLPGSMPDSPSLSRDGSRSDKDQDKAETKPAADASAVKAGKSGSTYTSSTQVKLFANAHGNLKSHLGTPIRGHDGVSTESEAGSNVSGYGNGSTGSNGVTFTTAEAIAAEIASAPCIGPEQPQVVEVNMMVAMLPPSLAAVRASDTTAGSVTSSLKSSARECEDAPRTPCTPFKDQHAEARSVILAAGAAADVGDFSKDTIDFPALLAAGSFGEEDLGKHLLKSPADVLISSGSGLPDGMSADYVAAATAAATDSDAAGGQGDSGSCLQDPIPEQEAGDLGINNSLPSLQACDSPSVQGKANSGNGAEAVMLSSEGNGEAVFPPNTEKHTKSKHGLFSSPAMREAAAQSAHAPVVQSPGSTAKNAFVTVAGVVRKLMPHFRVSSVATVGSPLAPKGVSHAVGSAATQTMVQKVAEEAPAAAAGTAAGGQVLEERAVCSPPTAAVGKIGVVADVDVAGALRMEKEEEDAEASADMLVEAVAEGMCIAEQEEEEQMQEDDDAEAVAGHPIFVFTGVRARTSRTSAQAAAPGAEQAVPVTGSCTKRKAADADGAVMGEPCLTPKAPRMVDAHVGADADVNQAQVHLDDVRVQLEAAAEEDVVAAGADSAAGSAIAESGAALAAADADEAQADAVEGVRVARSGSEVHAEEDVKVDEMRHAAAAEDAADTQALALQQTPAPTVEASDTLPVPAALKPVRKIAKAPGCFGNVFKGCFGGAAQRSP